MSQAIRKVSQLQLNKTSFFLCDIQEKFENLIFSYKNVVRIANKMVILFNLLIARIFKLTLNRLKLVKF
jgi:hypothetical protein